VEELGTRHPETRTDAAGFVRGDKGRPPFRRLLALRKIIAESIGLGPDAKRTRELYLELASGLGGELTVLTDAAVADIAAIAGERVAEGVSRVRAGDLIIEPGYDGVYGTVRIWPGPPGE
jgi:PHP family Zn ribbon phosphoesterase